MIKVTASTITFTSCKAGNPNPDQAHLKKRHEQSGFSAKSRKTMLSRLRNFMFFRRYELTDRGIKEKNNTSNVTFLTTTLPSKQIHTDKEIKSICLDNFLNKLRYHQGKFSYVWKAEPQHNGNIHFHFILDSYIDRKLCDKLWHDSIELLGYVTSFEKIHKHRNPPTNKIERAKSLRKVIGYATKYIAKISEGRIIDGQNWYCSKDLQTEVVANVLMPKKDEQLIKKRLRNLGLYCASNEYSEKYYLSDTTDIKDMPIGLRNVYSDIMQYYLGRQICEDGMSRKVTLQAETRIINYQPKRKLLKQGFEVFEDNLFGLEVAQPKKVIQKRNKYR